MIEVEDEPPVPAQPRLKFVPIDNEIMFAEIETMNEALRKYMHIFVLLYDPKSSQYRALVPALNAMYDKYTRLGNDSFVQFFSVDVNCEALQSQITKHQSLKYSPEDPLLLYY